MFKQLIYFFRVGAVVVSTDLPCAVNEREDVAVEDAACRRIAFDGGEEVPIAREVIQVLFVTGEEFPDFGVLP